MTNSEFKWSLQFFLAFPENSFNFATQNLAKKTEKYPF